jgi:mannose-6-phosphate isomerase-like protein (cupin superfamily)
VAFFVTEMRPGAVASEHVHPPPCDHIYYILSGRGRITAGGKTFNLEPNLAVFVPGGTPHETVTLGDETLRFVVLSAPPAALVLTKK